MAEENKKEGDAKREAQKVAQLQKEEARQEAAEAQAPPMGKNLQVSTISRINR